MKITEQANGRVEVREFQGLRATVAYAKALHSFSDPALLRQLSEVERAAEEYDISVAAARTNKAASIEAVRAESREQRRYLADRVALLRANAEEASHGARTARETETAVWLLSVSRAYENLLVKTEAKLG